MGSAKDLVALSLAHECDELKLALEPLRDLAQDSSSHSSLGKIIAQSHVEIKRRSLPRAVAQNLA